MDADRSAPVETVQQLRAMALERKAKWGTQVGPLLDTLASAREFVRTRVAEIGVAAAQRVQQLWAERLALPKAKRSHVSFEDVILYVVLGEKAWRCASDIRQLMWITSLITRRILDAEAVRPLSLSAALKLAKHASQERWPVERQREWAKAYLGSTSSVQRSRFAGTYNSPLMTVIEQVAAGKPVDAPPVKEPSRPPQFSPEVMARIRQKVQALTPRPVPLSEDEFAVRRQKGGWWVSPQDVVHAVRALVGFGPQWVAIKDVRRWLEQEGKAPEIVVREAVRAARALDWIEMQYMPTGDARGTQVRLGEKAGQVAREQKPVAWEQKLLAKIQAGGPDGVKRETLQRATGLAVQDFDGVINGLLGAQLIRAIPGGKPGHRGRKGLRYVAVVPRAA